jgi:hypothetical protein
MACDAMNGGVPMSPQGDTAGGIVEPCHDDEACGVVFEVLVGARRAQGYVSCVLLEALCGGVPEAHDWVAAYRRHRSVIDAVVAQRAPDEAWETVLVRAADLPLPG